MRFRAVTVRERYAQALTIIILLAALVLGLARKTGMGVAEKSPQDTIYSMQEAARTGNVKAYLASYTGPMEAALRQTLTETTEPAFAQYLRDSNAAIKGTAVSDPRITGTEAKVRVEYIYKDRNEAQTMYLEKGSNGWKISRADSDEPVKTLIPYGTPVR